MNNVLPFLEQLQRIELQLANQFFYDIAVSRVVTRVKTDQEIYFTVSSRESYQNALFIYNQRLRTLRRQELIDVDFHDHEMLQFGGDFYLVDHGTS